MPAMLFGVLAVNKYYGYYQTWGAVMADFGSQGVNAATRLPDVTLVADSGSGTLDGSHVHLQLAQRQGYTLRLMVTGPRSGITRAVYVYLPPQYFQPAFQAYRFPVIELLHGQPGKPEDWITVVGVTNTFDRLLAEKLARPAVVVMPDANGGPRISLQCLNQAGGPQDLTYLAEDLPERIAHMLRVQRPGRPGAWPVTPRAGSAPPTWPCATRTATGSPRCSAATSRRSATSWPGRPGWSARSAATAGCRRRTPRCRRSRPCPPAWPSPGSGWARAGATTRTWPMPSSSGRNCERGKRTCR